MSFDQNKSKKDPNLQDEQKNRNIPGQGQQGGTSQKQKDLDKGGKNIDKDKKSW